MKIFGSGRPSVKLLFRSASIFQGALWINRGAHVPLCSLGSASGQLPSSVVGAHSLNEFKGTYIRHTQG